jgi:hypothetical protein
MKQLRGIYSYADPRANLSVLRCLLVDMDFDALIIAVVVQEEGRSEPSYATANYGNTEGARGLFPHGNAHMPWRGGSVAGNSRDVDKQPNISTSYVVPVLFLNLFRVPPRHQLKLLAVLLSCQKWIIKRASLARISTSSNTGFWRSLAASGKPRYLATEVI